MRIMISSIWNTYSKVHTIAMLTMISRLKGTPGYSQAIAVYYIVQSHIVKNDPLGVISLIYSKPRDPNTCRSLADLRKSCDKRAWKRELHNMSSRTLVLVCNKSYHVIVSNQLWQKYVVWNESKRMLSMIQVIRANIVTLAMYCRYEIRNIFVFMVTR